VIYERPHPGFPIRIAVVLSLGIPAGFWSLWLWDMLHSYFPIYKIALDLEDLRSKAKSLKGSSSSYSRPPQVSEPSAEDFTVLLKMIHKKCLEYGLIDTSDMAKRILDGDAPETYADMSSHLDHLNGSLSNQLQKEAVFRVAPELKKYYEQDDLFGPEVSAAFPSCDRDIRKAGSCYALGQEDACVHHLMLVLERGLNVLATKLDVPYERTNWQNIIEQNAKKLKLRGAEFEFHREANAQFGFLKDAYRNHSEHARDDYYDMPKARSILDHVRDFMQALEKGGLTE